MKNKKALWVILLIFGTLPFIGVIGFEIYNAINGFSGICIKSCSYVSGFNAFLGTLLLYSVVYWPTYIIGIVLIILASIKLRKLKKLEK